MPGSESMHGMMFISALMDIGLALVALAILWVLLRLADWGTKQAQQRHERGETSLAAHWGQIMGRIESEPLSASLYYGARWLGGCIVLGMLLG